MAKKIWAVALLALALIVVGLVIQFGLEGNECNAQCDSTTEGGRAISQRQPVKPATDFEIAASRSRVKRLRWHHPREVSPEHFPPALIAKIVSSMRHSVVSTHVGLPKREVPITTNDQGLSAVGEIFNEFTTREFPHSFCNTEDYFLLWGTHTNKPIRGFVVPKKHVGVFCFALDGKHYWDVLHPGELLTRDPELKLGYLYHDSDPEERSKEIRARQEKEHRELLLEEKKIAGARKGGSQTE